jgi:YVTN family beta-propeller protein
MRAVLRVWLRCVRIGALGALWALPGSAAAQGGPYVNFETIPTRAVALSPDGSRLFVTNTPDARLEIFQVNALGLTPLASVPVGLEPVAVNARTNSEVWVVNHLSDSVSVVDVAATPPRVVRTLLVGDEPRDVVFAGPNQRRAFITAARRGQNHPDDTANETQIEGMGRADVWVFDAENLGESLGGNRVGIVTLFGDKPGSMGVSPDGSKVFVSLFTSGNETTAISQMAVCGTNGVTGRGQFSNQNDGPCRLRNGGMAPGGVPGPNVNQVDGTRNPRTAIITKFERSTGRWLDVLGRDWSAAVPFSLLDTDVFVIDANASRPQLLSTFAHVGTLNFSVATHPTNGKAYVATIEAINLNRFLSVPRLGAFPNPDRIGGASRTADPITGKALRGHLYESRIAVLSPGGAVQVRHLNKHIDYELEAQPAGVKERSVANPQGLAFSPDGSTLFVAALGSNKIVPFRTAEIDADTFVPDAATHIELSGDGGPTDMVFDRSGERMFVYRRFDNAVSIVDVAARRETASVSLFSPEPDSVRVGRKFFYDALQTSSNGEANCNVCHPAGDKDDLPWDLGTPFFGLTPNPNPFVSGDPNFDVAASQIFGLRPTIEFNPLKGPMTPLTLRGIKDSGPMFWRGDITNAVDPMDERLNFRNGLGIVFEALNGLDGPLADTSLDQLTDWALSIVPPPNPHRPLDNVLTPTQQAGAELFLGDKITDVIFTCADCHRVNTALGQFGTGGENTIEGETQFFKVTQLRTTYDKVGMFGEPVGDNGDPRTLGGPRGTNIGPQIRASGTLHDGTQAGAEEFLSNGVFQLNTQELFDVVNFVYAFPSNLAPVVGQQVTLRAGSGPDVQARVDLLQQRAGAAFVLPAPPSGIPSVECDLIARAVVAGKARGFLYDPAQDSFVDSAGEPITDAALRDLARVPGQEVTFSCVYPGAGERLALDRDLDGLLDEMEASPVDPLAQLIQVIEALLALARLFSGF